MKKTTNSNLEKHMKDAATYLVPNQADQIFEQPIEKASGDEWYLNENCHDRKKRGTTIKLVSSFAACLIIGVLSYIMINLRIDATIYLDVNPSIELQANRQERILVAKARNHDGKVVLEDMDLKHTDLDVAVNAILGSMVKHGYISQAQSIILLSVDSNNQELADTLKLQLSDEINSCLSSLIGSGSTFNQDVHTDKALEELAHKYNITPGKAALLQKLVDTNPSLNYANLAALSLDDLTLQLQKSGIDLRNFANYTGTDFKKPPKSNETNPPQPVEKHKTPNQIDQQTAPTQEIFYNTDDQIEDSDDDSDDDSDTDSDYDEEDSLLDDDFAEDSD